MAGNSPAYNRYGFAVTCAVMAGVVLRSIGLSYGLPAIYNPDEVAIMNRAIGLTQNALNPHNFLYPSLYFYALLAWEGAAFVAGLAAGVFDSAAAFERSFFVDPSYVYLAGRWLSVVCGAATIGVTAALGRRLFGRAAGAWAAWVLAVAPLAVRDAHYVKHDVPVTLLITLALLALTRWTERATTSGLIAAGALTGLAISTHYYAVFAAVPLVAAAWFGLTLDGTTAPGPMRHRWRRMATGLVAAGIAFAATSPFLLVEPLTAFRDIVANREIVVDRATETSGPFGSLGFYAVWLSRDALGVSGFVACAVGVAAVARTGRTRAMLALLFPGLFLLFIANTFPASRYLNPVLPFAAILAGAAAAWLGRFGWSTATIGRIVLLAAVVEAATASIRTDRFFQQTDTRTLAEQWIEQQIPAESTVLIQPYSVPLHPSRSSLIEALTANLGDPARATVKFQRQLSLSPYPSPAYRILFLGDGGVDPDKIYVSPSVFDRGTGLSPLRALSVSYVILKQYNVVDPAMAALGAALQREGRLLARFSPYRTGLDGPTRVAPFLHNSDARIRPELERPGPIVEIWTPH
jgi:hypothetical protein